MIVMRKEENGSIPFTQVLPFIALTFMHSYTLNWITAGYIKDLSCIKGLQPKEPF